MVRVYFKGILKEYSPGKNEYIDIDYRNDLTVEDLLSLLETDQGQVGIITVDGKLIDNWKYNVGKEAVVELYPVFGGGR